MTADEFEHAVSAHYTAVFYFALSLSKNESAACDLTQESFRRLAAKGQSVRETAKVKSWLLTTCYREFLREHRHATQFPQVELSVVEESLSDTTPESISPTDASFLLDAMQQIDEIFRVPVALFYLEDLSYKEIAAILEIPTGTVMSRLARGKAQLRALLTTNTMHTRGNAESTLEKGL